MNPEHIYEAGLGKSCANYTSLSPLSFLKRSASIYPNHKAIIYGDKSFSWSDTYRRCCQFASALKKRGLVKGDTVSAMLPNVPAMYEASFAVAMAGGVLNTLNIRLNADSIAFMLEHAEAKVVLTDREFSGVIGPALKKLKNKFLL